MSIVLLGSTSGSCTLQEQAIAGTTVLTLPTTSGTVITTASTAVVTQAMLDTNVAGNGPAFAAYLSPFQTGISQGVVTKVNLSAEDFDTNNNFNTSTYNFTPTVAGYYLLTAVASFGSAGGTYPSGGQILIYKNSGAVAVNQYSGVNQIFGLCASTLVYMNGSTDTASLYDFMTGGTNGALNGGSYGTYLTGVLARAA